MEGLLFWKGLNIFLSTIYCSCALGQKYDTHSHSCCKSELNWQQSTSKCVIQVFRFICFIMTDKYASYYFYLFMLKLCNPNECPNLYKIQIHKSSFLFLFLCVWTFRVLFLPLFCLTDFVLFAFFVKKSR